MALEIHLKNDPIPAKSPHFSMRFKFLETFQGLFLNENLLQV